MNNRELLDMLLSKSIERINRYIQGEHVMKSRGTRIERDNVTAVMMMNIESNLNIVITGDDIGSFHFGMYKREIKRKRRKSDYIPWHLRKEEAEKK